MEISAQKQLNKAVEVARIREGVFQKIKPKDAAVFWPGIGHSPKKRKRRKSVCRRQKVHAYYKSFSAFPQNQSSDTRLKNVAYHSRKIR